MAKNDTGKKSVFKMIADIVSWTIFALLMLLAAFLIYYVIATNIYASKGERFKPIVSLYTIISGSMLPTIKVYDVVVNLRVDDPSKLKEGDVITFISQSKINYGETITHRINAITYDNGTYYFTTKGDNNLVPDESPVEFNNVIGKVILKIPQLGQAQFFLLKQGSKLFLILIPSFGILIYDLLKMLNLFDTKKKVDKSLETKDNKLSKDEEEKLKNKIRNRLENKGVSETLVAENSEENIKVLENENSNKEKLVKDNNDTNKELSETMIKEDNQLLNKELQHNTKEIISNEDNKVTNSSKENTNKNVTKSSSTSKKNDYYKNNNFQRKNNNSKYNNKGKYYNNKTKNNKSNNLNKNNKPSSNVNNDIDVDKVLKKIKEKNY